MNTTLIVRGILSNLGIPLIIVYIFSVLSRKPFDWVLFVMMAFAFVASELITYVVFRGRRAGASVKGPRPPAA